MFLTYEGTNHFIYEVVDVEKLHRNTSVVDLNWQVVGYIITECGDGTVVIGTTPLAKEIRETVDEYMGSYLLAILEEEIFACLLTTTIL